MILSFKTKINGEPTYFPEKIWQGFPNQEDLLEEWFTLGKVYEGYNFHPDAAGMFPKIHTIRKDDKNRWNAGIMIDFFINARQKDMFRFAPKIPVVSVQIIQIKFMSIWNSSGLYAKPIVKIDGKLIYDMAGNGKEILEKISKNDGFKSIDDFFSYFNNDFEGKIIHWTDFKY